MNKKSIKTIEDISLNAWPSHQMQLYDGWILRFSHFYTHRTNCVEQVGTSTIPIDEKIDYCEMVYRRWKTPCIFKITPLTSPAFDWTLERRGYEIGHETTVMCRGLESGTDLISEFISEGFENKNALKGMDTNGAAAEVETERRISDEWIDALFDIKGNATVTHLKVVPSMYAAIPKDVFCACIRREGRIAATGLGILDREYVGIYAINVARAYRRQGMAERICRTLLSYGREAGASNAYLQVTKYNEAAKALYRKLGFAEEYDYWFRVRDME